MHLTDMKQSVQEDKVESVLLKEEMEKKYNFPPGLCITLDEKSLRKLEKRVEDFNVDDEVLVMAKASVKGIHVSEGEYESKSVNLQIEEMAVKEPPKDDLDRNAQASKAEILYKGE